MPKVSAREKHFRSLYSGRSRCLDPLCNLPCQRSFELDQQGLHVPSAANLQIAEPTPSGHFRRDCWITHLEVVSVRVAMISRLQSARICATVFELGEKQPVQGPIVAIALFSEIKINKRGTAESRADSC